jgi:outer membrane protein X
MKKVFFNTIFKKVAIVAIALGVGISVNAQSAGDKAFGAHIAIGTDSDFPSFGIGAKFQYNAADPLRLEGSFTYFFPKTEEESMFGVKLKASLSMWELGATGHYLLPVADKITLYPLAGLSVVGLKAKVEGSGWGSSAKESESDTNLGINLGAGLDFKITDDFFLNAELKYKIVKDWSSLWISVGITKMF